MRFSNAKVLLLTSITQCLILVPVWLCLFMLPHMWDSAFVNIFEGKPLPAFTSWILHAFPADDRGLFSLVSVFSLTPLCIGLMLIATAPDETSATQRIMCLGSVTWGLALLAFVMVVTALSLPFSYTLGILGRDPDLDGVCDAHGWIIGLRVYICLLLAATAWICLRKKKW